MRGLLYKVGGTITASRDNENPSKINVSVTANLNTKSGSTAPRATSFSIHCSNGSSSTYYTLTGAGQTSDYASSASRSISTSFITNDAVTFYVHYHCCDNGNPSSPYCTVDQDHPGYGPYPDVTMSGSVSVGSYNPYVAPTGPTYCKLSSNSLKPDNSISVSWKGETGGTPGINHFQIELSQWRGTSQLRSYTRVSGPIYYSTHGYNPCTWSEILTNLVNYDDNSDIIQIRPGDKIQFHVACYTQANYDGWFSTVTATDSGASGGVKDISIYKDGIIYYKDLSGETHECTLGYRKDTNGNSQKARYIQVKDVNGTVHSIDVYTTHYEDSTFILEPIDFPIS